MSDILKIKAAAQNLLKMIEEFEQNNVEVPTTYKGLEYIKSMDDWPRGLLVIEKGTALTTPSVRLLHMEVDPDTGALSCENIYEGEISNPEAVVFIRDTALELMRDEGCMLEYSEGKTPYTLIHGLRNVWNTLDMNGGDFLAAIDKEIGLVINNVKADKFANAR